MGLVPPRVLCADTNAVAATDDDDDEEEGDDEGEVDPIVIVDTNERSVRG